MYFKWFDLPSFFFFKNGGSVRLVSGPGSRTLPSLSAQQYQNFQGPAMQLRSDLQQVQDYLQQYGEGYPDLHHAQIGARNFLEQYGEGYPDLHQRLISQRRWDSQQVEEHSQQYGAQGYPKLYHSKIGSQNLQEQILMDRTSDNSGQQYQNFQGLNPQLRWDSQQVQEHSQPYGSQGYPNFHHSQIGARNLQEQILMDRIMTIRNSLDYSIPQHSSTGASHDYQDPIVGDRFLGSSARYPNLQHSQIESFRKDQDQS
ncbi:hypothetical protein FRX31_006160 [Thalictrum thalictroides]|uniref:Uncharacterized protein n=1 Tax=Thalictrum thalictroides TaxID=46969 RepID=A0A7J6X4D4_THATH|nr:hypothetical protein FRX31_006160 [Thalictrum thalictroides]